MRVSDFDYDLPKELVAAYPADRRDAARMMVIDRATGRIDHALVSDFPNLIEPGEVVVLNDAKVLPARLFAEKPAGEVFLLEMTEPLLWRALTKPARRFRRGLEFVVGGTRAKVVDEGAMGVRWIAFDQPPDLERHGHMPIPPYLGREALPLDRERYQTVFASRPGAVAAPTAGLHFTWEMLARIPHTFITLYVGEGTFRDIKVEEIHEHQMHSEKYEISEEAHSKISAAKTVCAVGTTVVRTLEGATLPDGSLSMGCGETDLFITPGYDFNQVDRLLTNFHLPRSTLLMLISAFAGQELIREAYRVAIQERYRFFSYGDCMFIR
ncbi:MAG: tRNA preQ1(34) S-adenosylmethionine ribosyltransferase-isomerase QueA [Verrucomicrobiia bacterium]